MADVLIQTDACAVDSKEVAPLLFHGLRQGGGFFRRWISNWGR